MVVVTYSCWDLGTLRTPPELHTVHDFLCFLVVSILPISISSLAVMQAKSRWLIHSLLTHCGLVTPYGDIDLVQHLPRLDLLPDCTRPLPEPMLIYHLRCSGAIIWEQFNLQHQRLDFLLPHLPRPMSLCEWTGWRPCPTYAILKNKGKWTIWNH